MTDTQSTTPNRRHRRGSARTKVPGLARIELGSSVGGYRVGDLSFGGLRVVGRPAQISPKVGDRVHVMLAGRSEGKTFDLDAWGEVRRIGEDDLGLSWDLSNPCVAEQVAYWVASSAADYEEYQVS